MHTSDKMKIILSYTYIRKFSQETFVYLPWSNAQWRSNSRKQNIHHTGLSQYQQTNFSLEVLLWIDWSVCVSPRKYPSHWTITVPAKKKLVWKYCFELTGQCVSVLGKNLTQCQFQSAPEWDTQVHVECCNCTSPCCRSHGWLGVTNAVTYLHLRLKIIQLSQRPEIKTRDMSHAVPQGTRHRYSFLTHHSPLTSAAFFLFLLRFFFQNWLSWKMTQYSDQFYGVHLLQVFWQQGHGPNLLKN